MRFGWDGLHLMEKLVVNSRKCPSRLGIFVFAEDQDQQAGEALGGCRLNEQAEGRCYC
jgi:hypothetical protein